MKGCPIHRSLIAMDGKVTIHPQAVAVARSFSTTQNERVPHPSQSHRDGWESNRPPTGRCSCSFFLHPPKMKGCADSSRTVKGQRPVLYQPGPQAQVSRPSEMKGLKARPINHRGNRIRSCSSLFSQPPTPKICHFDRALSKRSASKGQRRNPLLYPALSQPIHRFSDLRGYACSNAI
jgi:hypothetical protein